MVFNKASENVCPYCQRRIAEPSKDHIIPDFLGGTATIDTCAGCNNLIGRTIEAYACKNLEKVAFSIEGFGLKLRWSTDTLPRALEHDGITFDLVRNDEGESKPRLSSPIREVDKNQKLLAISYGSVEEAQKALENLERKGKYGGPVTKIQKEISVSGEPFNIDIDASLCRLALKMTTALSTRLPEVVAEDLETAGAIMRGDHLILPGNVVPLFETVQDLDLLRPKLSHTIYVERTAGRIYGVVQFYGFIQFYCLLTEAAGGVPHAIVMYVDPITGERDSCEVQPLNLLSRNVAVPFLNPLEPWFAKLKAEAIDRGATGAINLVGITVL